MKKLKLASSLVAFFLMAGGIFATIIPASAYAADKCSPTFFSIPAWYRGLTVSDTDCNIKKISNKGGTDVTLNSFIWTVVLNISDGLFRIAGVIATGFIVWAGFQYMISQGNSAKVAAAKTTLTNAIVGLIITILAVGITNFALGLIK